MHEENQTNDNENEVTQNTMTTEDQVSHESEEEKSVGGMIGAVIVVVLIVIGGLYLLEQKSVEQNAALSAEQILAEPDIVTETLEAQGTSDEIDAIEADVTATDLEGLDLELGDIEAEFGNI